ncbi:type IV toxin-antitoxin system AbiEi family antitoxin domain-containing protein [Microbacterium sp. CJ88]|uniref:type IV toxin-antitoxin system AbiEi family antitoxin domain-containing protein n=1 Tax=Microbacterium sp. CJ88 TaxID=3445672 RepID=UPI003F65D346
MLIDSGRQSPIALIPARTHRNAARSTRSGDLARVLRGVYADAAEWGALTPWDRYLARVHAALIHYPDAAVCLESAAVVRGLPIFGDPRTVHLLIDDGRPSRNVGEIQLHSTRSNRGQEWIDGIRVTALDDTVVDIARLRHHAVGLAVADAALRIDLDLTREAFLEENASRASSRGRVHARWALERADAAPESPLESIDRAVIGWLGFPEPELQVTIGPDRVDKWWPTYAVAGEGDGDLKYDGRFGDPQQAMRRRHERDARLFRHGARSVPHWGWAEAVAVEPLAAILRSAGLPVERARDHAELFSLRRTLGPALAQ